MQAGLAAGSLGFFRWLGESGKGNSMSETQAMTTVQLAAWRPGQNLGRLLKAGRLWDAIRDSADDLAEPEKLRKVLENLIELADLIGLDAAFADKLRSIVGNPQVLGIVARVIGFVLRGLGRDEADPSEPRPVSALATVEVQSMAVWLPVALEILRVVWAIVAERRKRREVA